MAVPSVSRKLVLAVAVPLVLFFVMTYLVLDYLFGSLSDRAQQDLVEQQLVSLVSTIEASDDGSIDLRVLDPESRLLTPGSGHYARVTDAKGAELWSSPSLAGINMDFGATLAPGQRRLVTKTLPDGVSLRCLSRGLRWDYATGRSIDLVLHVAESAEPYRAQLISFRSTIIGWLSMMAVGLLLVLGWLLRLVLSPVRRLESEIGEVEAGRRDRLGGGYPRELAGTAANLNTLLVSERRRITRYRDSLGNLAHELKTPLAVMRAALGKGNTPPEAINTEIDRISAIVNRQLARAANSGGVSIGQAPCAVYDIVVELRTTMLKVRRAKDLTIELSIQPGAAFVGDAGDLTEALGNLLDNACKWCRSRVCVSARVVTSDSKLPQLILQVDDDGAGVVVADRQRILDRGVRADEFAEGHGLGLAMVNDTVALYDGELRILESPELGGARFLMTLPGRLLESRA